MLSTLFETRTATAVLPEDVQPVRMRLVRRGCSVTYRPELDSHGERTGFYVMTARWPR